MPRHRDRRSAHGLLPLMEARLWRDGVTVTYRYHPIGGRPINLGQDKDAAIRAVLDMRGQAPDRGTVAELWRLYQRTPGWAQLADGTRTDYTTCSAPLLRVFGAMAPGAIRPADLARYMRQERSEAPVRANREMALLSNLLNLAIERGELEANPCRQVRRNKEQPRREVPEPADLAAFLAWAQDRGGQASVLAGMAEFAALTGNRRIEFRELHWPQVGEEIRLQRAKQRGRETVEVLAVSDALAALLERMKAHQTSPMGAVFPAKDGGAHSERGFKSAWARLMRAAREAGVVEKAIRFHDLRAYFTTRFKRLHGALPDLHSDPGTTARVYDRAKEVKRRTL